jgi:hypothetical protein
MITTDKDRVCYTCPNCRNDLLGPPEMTEYRCGVCGHVEKLRRYGKSRRALFGALLFLGTFGASYTACDAHASASPCPDLARAEASMLTVQARQLQAFDPGETRIADALVAAAVEQLRTARVVCGTSQPPAYVSPFEPTVDPWEPDDLDATDLDATAAVLDVPAKMGALQADLAKVVRP